MQKPSYQKFARDQAPISVLGDKQLFEAGRQDVWVVFSLLLMKSVHTNGTAPVAFRCFLEGEKYYTTNLLSPNKFFSSKEPKHNY